MNEKLNATQQKLVEDNYNLIYPVINKLGTFTQAYLSREDLEQMALFHLCRAALSFDTNKGTKFSTYATAVIRNGLFDEFKALNKHNPESTQTRIYEAEDDEDTDFELDNTTYSACDNVLDEIASMDLKNELMLIAAKNNKMYLGVQALLYVLRGYSIKEAAKYIDINIKQCYNYVSLVKEELAGHLFYEGAIT